MSSAAMAEAASNAEGAGALFGVNCASGSSSVVEGMEDAAVLSGILAFSGISFSELEVDVF